MAHAALNTLPDFYVPMLDHGRYGRQAVSDPEHTRRDIVDMIRNGDYPADAIIFILHVHDGVAEDCTDDLISEATGFLSRAEMAQRGMVRA